MQKNFWFVCLSRADNFITENVDHIAIIARVILGYVLDYVEERDLGLPKCWLLPHAFVQLVCLEGCDVVCLSLIEILFRCPTFHTDQIN